MKKENLEKTIKKFLKTKKENLFPINIQIPSKKEFGDFTTNIALVLSSKVRKNSNEIAEQLKQFLLENHKTEIERVEVAKHGFVNIHLKKEQRTNILLEVLTLNENFGKSNINKSKKIFFEFISANPTGLLHIGHARNAIIGDITIRAMEATGYNVHRNYYINDYGNQMNDLGESIFWAYKKTCDNTIKIPKVGYQGQDIYECAKELHKKYKDFWFDKEWSNEMLVKFRDLGYDYFLKEIKKTLKQINIKEFDSWTSENKLYIDKKVDESLEKLKKIKDATYEKDGALWLNSTKYGDDNDRVLKKSDGLFTYMVADIANHIEKYKTNSDVYIWLLGADHAGYETRIKAALTFLKKDASKMHTDYLQMVRLLKDGKEVKMSKRSGNAITINEMENKFGSNVLRFFIASRAKSTHFDLDYDKLKDTSSNNPMHYIMYSYARTISVTKHLKKEAKLLKESKFELLAHENEIKLLKMIGKTKETIIKTATFREPQILVNFTFDLAKSFHSFYNSCHIKGQEKELMNQRYTLLIAYKIVILNLFKILGIKPIDKM